MSYSASRLTLYAILASIEEDLRDLVVLHLGNEMPPEQLMGKDLWDKCQLRIARDQSPMGSGSSLDEVLMYADFGDIQKLLHTYTSKLPTPVAQHLKSWSERLEKLLPIRNRVAHLRPLNFDDLAVTLDFAEVFAKESDVIWKELRNTLSRLRSEPSYVLGLQIPFYEWEATNEKHNLPLPDFDETGFIGRRQFVSELVKLCLGPYPVVSIVGEGGLGKTALALKVAYEILDLPDCPFDAVVWTSSKTAHLTAQEVVSIEGAIRDSLGMLKSVADHLAGVPVDNPVAEVLSYLESFKILLILDNLETVLDERMRGFLGHLPAGSKVMITSRIGLGAYECPVKLQPMNQGEAVQLTRALAKVRGVATLDKLENSKLANYCDKMKFNPGFIKWFVSAVQSGRRPEEVLSKPDLFLDFCMSNVYEYLAEDSRHILQSMQAAPGRRNQAELAFLNNMDALVLQRALQQLLTTNMIVMSSSPRSLSFETQYDLSDLARAYLAKHHPVEPAEYEKLKKRKRELVSVQVAIERELRADPFSYFSITTRSRGDLITAKHLYDAMRHVMKKNYVIAEKLLSMAASLAPGYFEVCRIEAIMKDEQRDYSGARLAYEAAVELEPNHAPLRVWFAGFLLRSENETEAAHTQILEAFRINPTAVTVQIELARIKLYVHDFAEARKAIDTLQAREGIPMRSQVIIYDLHFQFFMRQAEYQILQRDNLGALVSLEKLKDEFQQCPSRLIDNKMTKRLGWAIRTAQKCALHIQTEEQKQRAQNMVEWLYQVSNSNPQPRSKIVDNNIECVEGEVARLKIDKGFGFIKGDDGCEFFFHCSALVIPENWEKIKIGNRVKFRKVDSEKGPIATEVDLFL